MNVTLVCKNSKFFNDVIKGFRSEGHPGLSDWSLKALTSVLSSREDTDTEEKAM